MYHIPPWIIVLLSTQWAVVAIGEAAGIPSIDCSRSYVARVGVSGVITSYNFPFDYRHNLTCIHRLHVGPLSTGSSRVVCLSFHRFALETSSPFCPFDYVEIGWNPTVKYCGTGVWQYGVAVNSNDLSTVWSNNFCWTVKGPTFELKFSTDNNINGSGFYATYSVSESAQNFSSLLTGAPCGVDEFTCFNRRCIPLSQRCDTRDDCGDGSDEAYAHARCRVHNVLACDFSSAGGSTDGFCDLTHEGWFRVRGPLLPYGPPGDHTNGSADDYYVYADGRNSSALLLSPELSLPSSSAVSSRCLSFYYYSYGSTYRTTLRVYVGREQVYSRPEWSRRRPLAGGWTRGAILVRRVAAPVQVVFAVEFGDAFGGVAVDDISILDGLCDVGDVSCNFELGLCSWQSVSEIHHSGGVLRGDQVWRVHSQLLYSVGPQWDRSSTDGGGFYLFTNASSAAGGDTSNRALLLGPDLSVSPSLHSASRCLQFAYHMHGTARGVCNLRAYILQVDGTLRNIWTQDCDVRDAWIDTQITFTVDEPYQIVLEAIMIPSGRAEVAIDEIYLEDDECSNGTVVCGRNQFMCVSDGACVSMTLHCDGVVHCADGSDEKLGCVVTTSTLAPVQVDSDSDDVDGRLVDVVDGSSAGATSCSSATHFWCLDGSACVPRAWLCDTANDCEDKSDEGPDAGCTGALLPICRRGEPSCRPGHCVGNPAVCSGTGAAVLEPADDVDHTRHACTGQDCTQTPPLNSCPPDVACSVGCSPDGLCRESVAVTSSTALNIVPIIGATVGAVVAVFLVILIVVIILVRRRHKRRLATSQTRRRLPVVSDVMTFGPESTVWLNSGTGAIVRPPYYRRHAASSAAAGQPPATDEMPPPYDIVMKDSIAERAAPQSSVVRRPDRQSRAHIRRSAARLSLPPLGSNPRPFRPTHRRAESDTEEHVYEDPMSLRRSQSRDAVSPENPTSPSDEVSSPDASADSSTATDMSGFYRHHFAPGFSVESRRSDSPDYRQCRPDVLQRSEDRGLADAARQQPQRLSGFGVRGNLPAEQRVPSLPCFPQSSSTQNLNSAAGGGLAGQQRVPRIRLGTTALHPRPESRIGNDWCRSGEFNIEQPPPFGAFSPLSAVGCPHNLSDSGRIFSVAGSRIPRDAGRGGGDGLPQRSLDGIPQENSENAGRNRRSDFDAEMSDLQTRRPKSGSGRSMHVAARARNTPLPDVSEHSLAGGRPGTTSAAGSIPNIRPSSVHNSRSLLGPGPSQISPLIDDGDIGHGESQKNPDQLYPERLRNVDHNRSGCTDPDSSSCPLVSANRSGNSSTSFDVQYLNPTSISQGRSEF